MSRRLHSHREPRARTTLVFATDGLRLEAALADRRGRLLGSLARACDEPMEAARRAIRELRETGRARQMVLVTDEAFWAGVELPAALARRSPEEIHTAVSYELEGARAQRAGTRPIGALLARLGALDAAQVELVLQQQEEESRCSRPAVRRFGEIARERFALSAASIARALAAQRFSLGSEEPLRCAWTCRLPERDPGERVAFSAVGMGAARLEAWRELAREAGMSLAAVLPYESAPLGLVPPQAWRAPGALLHLGVDFAALVRWGPGAALERTVPRRLHFSAAELAGWLAERGIERPWIAPADPAARALAQELRVSLPEAELLAPPPGAGGESLALLGAAARARTGAARELLPLLGPRSPSDPRRPLRLALSAAALLALAGGLGLLHAELHGRAEALASRLASLSAQRSALAREQSAALEHNLRMVSQQERLAALDGSVRAAEAWIEAEVARRAVAQRELALQRGLLANLLEDLEQSVDDSVQLSSLRSDEPGTLELELLATSPAAGHGVLRALSLRLAERGLHPAGGRTQGAGGGTHRIHAGFRSGGRR